MLKRLTLNFIVYLVFGGGIFAFVAMRGPPPRPDFPTVVMAALGLALWSGGLTSVIEVAAMRVQDLVKRALLAGLLGALSLGGFAVILSLLAWHSLPVSFVALGVVAGALMHAARAFSRGPQPMEERVHPKELIADGALVIDVRSPDEFSAGHHAAAKNLPVKEAENRIDDVVAWAGGDKDKPIVVYCASGARSARVKAVLERAGFTHVVNGGSLGQIS